MKYLVALEEGHEKNTKKSSKKKKSTTTATTTTATTAAAKDEPGAGRGRRQDPGDDFNLRELVNGKEFLAASQLAINTLSQIHATRKGRTEQSRIVDQRQIRYAAEHHGER